MSRLSYFRAIIILLMALGSLFCSVDSRLVYSREYDEDCDHFHLPGPEHRPPSLPGTVIYGEYGLTAATFNFLRGRDLSTFPFRLSDPFYLSMAPKGNFVLTTLRIGPLPIDATTTEAASYELWFHSIQGDTSYPLLPAVKALPSYGPTPRWLSDEHVLIRWFEYPDTTETPVTWAIFYPYEDPPRIIPFDGWRFEEFFALFFSADNRYIVGDTLVSGTYGFDKKFAINDLLEGQIIRLPWVDDFPIGVFDDRLMFWNRSKLADSESELYYSDFSGKNLVQLTHFNEWSSVHGIDYSVLSPNGGKIFITVRPNAYITTDYLFDLTTQEYTRLCASVGNLIWSPDSRYVAFTVEPPPPHYVHFELGVTNNNYELYNRNLNIYIYDTQSRTYYYLIEGSITDWTFELSE